MRVLLISGSFPPIKCGVGDYSAKLAQALAAQPGMEVEVLTSPGAAACPGVSLIMPDISWTWKDMGKIVRSVKEFAPDLVHIQFPTEGYGKNTMPFWIPLALCFTGFRVVQTWHEPLRWRSLYWYLPAALLRGGLVVAEPDFSELAAAWVRPFLKYKQVRFIPVGSSIPRVDLDIPERTAIRSRFCGEGERLIAYFGFASPSKGIELLLELADPVHDKLVLLCELNETDLYQKSVLDKIHSGVWHDRVTVTGFLPPEEVGSVLAASDAAVFPFVNGVAFRNTSFLAARNQGTFVLTTSRKRQGYAADENVYYALPGDVASMQQALDCYAGHHGALIPGSGEWSRIAEQHTVLYRDAVN